MDKFYIGEIIIPFGKQVWGVKGNDFAIPLVESLDEDQQKSLAWLSRDTPLDDVTGDQLDVLRDFFKAGTIPLETVGISANYIFQKSIACHPGGARSSRPTSPRNCGGWPCCRMPSRPSCSSCRRARSGRRCGGLQAVRCAVVRGTWRAVSLTGTGATATLHLALI